MSLVSVISLLEKIHQLSGKEAFYIEEGLREGAIDNSLIKNQELNEAAELIEVYIRENIREDF